MKISEFQSKLKRLPGNTELIVFDKMHKSVSEVDFICMNGDCLQININWGNEYNPYKDDDDKIDRAELEEIKKLHEAEYGE
jgi:hypothetical protein